MYLFIYLFIYQYTKTAKRCIFILVVIIYCLLYITVQSLRPFFMFLKDILKISKMLQKRQKWLNIIINLKLKTIVIHYNLVMYFMKLIRIIVM